MSRNYTPKYLGMPKEKASLTIAFIRNYDLFIDEAESLLANGMGITTDGQPKGANTADPTAITAGRRERLLDDIRIIEKAKEHLPQEYQQGIWEWVKEGKPLYQCKGTQYASDRTWYYHKRFFVQEVAYKKGWWDGEID